MKNNKTVILIIVLVLITALVIAKVSKNKSTSPEVASDVIVQTPAVAAPNEVKPATAPAEQPATEAAAGKALPSMLELGSVGCKPCEYMAPIIDSLEKELAGKVIVKFYDVTKNPDIGEKYAIMTIPTQVFLDADGKELFRHIGVFEKENILAKLKELKMLK